MKMQNYSCDLYRLGDLTNYPMNYHVTGSVRLAHTRQRMEEFAHVRSMARQMGFEMEMMTTADMRDIYCPFLRPMIWKAACGTLMTILTQPS